MPSVDQVSTHVEMKKATTKDGVPNLINQLHYHQQKQARKYSIDRLNSVRHCFTEMPCNVTPIANVLSKGLGISHYGYIKRSNANTNATTMRLQSTSLAGSMPASKSLVKTKSMKHYRSRKKQIELGKSTKGYLNYIKLIPKNERRKHIHPQTPDYKSENMSKRRFQGLVSAWRRQLHEWDNIDTLSLPPVSTTTTTTTNPITNQIKSNSLIEHKNTNSTASNNSNNEKPGCYQHNCELIKNSSVTKDSNQDVLKMDKITKVESTVFDMNHMIDTSSDMYDDEDDSDDSSDDSLISKQEAIDALESVIINFKASQSSKQNTNDLDQLCQTLLDQYKMNM